MIFLLCTLIIVLTYYVYYIYTDKAIINKAVTRHVELNTF